MTDALETLKARWRTGDPHPESVFAVLETSGTGGIPKRVPIRRRQLLAAARSIDPELRPGPGGAWLLDLPLHRMGGLGVVTRSLIYGTDIIQTDDPLQALKTDTRIHTVSMVGRQLARLLADGDFNPHGAFRGVLLGGGAVEPALIQACRDRNIPVIPSFGMTETAGAVIRVPYALWKTAPPGTSGRVAAPNEARIREGQLELRGPQIFDGYEDASLNAAAFTADGWFRTGDHARIEDGWVFIESRRTDRIVTGGVNVDPDQVEAAIRNLEGVSECAVVGLPDAEWGQCVTAVLVSDGRWTLASAREALKTVLPDAARPRRWIEWAIVPVTDTGKVKRAEIRDRLLGGQG